VIFALCCDAAAVCLIQACQCVLVAPDDDERGRQPLDGRTKIGVSGAGDLPSRRHRPFVRREGLVVAADRGQRDSESVARPDAERRLLSGGLLHGREHLLVELDRLGVAAELRQQERDVAGRQRPAHVVAPVDLLLLLCRLPVVT
jgi:hypothetical protein